MGQQYDLGIGGDFVGELDQATVAASPLYIPSILFRDAILD